MASLQNSPIGRLAQLPVSSKYQSPSTSIPKCRTTCAVNSQANAAPSTTNSSMRILFRRGTMGGHRARSACRPHLWGTMASPTRMKLPGTAICGLEFKDFIGGDLLGFDLDQWEQDVETHKAIALYPPHEGGLEGRYASRLKSRGYDFLDLTARGLGDVEAYLSKVHAVRPPHLGKQKIVRWYYPPEVDYRLSLIPENSKGLIVWIIEAKVLSKAELQYLCVLPTLQPRVRVIAECGTWRKLRWKPLKEIAGLELPATSS